ncbi:hypothetical protein EG329_005483 [Mollisiaceae sp. DMI_Dod_QoI]|nr:hypothetical protein EG329_005483 [Helotiales sp. DMI_Dod_QoI]
MSFTSFPKLSPELRLMIWKHALPGPRVITISSNTSDNDEYLPGLWINTLSLNGPRNDSNSGISVQGDLTAADSLYYTCKESHSAVREHYGIYFASRLPHPILFDPKIDTLYLQDYNAARSFFSLDSPPCENEDLRSISNLAILLPCVRNTEISMWSNTNDYGILYAAVKLFTNLKHFLLVDRSPIPLTMSDLNTFFSALSQHYQSEGPKMFEKFDKDMLSRIRYEVMDEIRLLELAERVFE